MVKYTITVDKAISGDIRRRAEKKGLSPEEWIKEYLEAYCYKKLKDALTYEDKTRGKKK